MEGVSVGDCGTDSLANLTCLASGDASGDSEGNDSSVFAVLSVDAECFLARRVADLREAVESCDDVRSSLSFPPELAMVVSRSGSRLQIWRGEEAFSTTESDRYFVDYIVRSSAAERWRIGKWVAECRDVT